MTDHPKHYSEAITDDIIDASEHDRGADLAHELKDLTRRNPRLAQRGLVRALEAGLDNAAFMAGIAFAERATAQRDAARTLSAQLALESTIGPSDHSAA